MRGEHYEPDILSVSGKYQIFRFTSHDVEGSGKGEVKESGRVLDIPLFQNGG